MPEQYIRAKKRGRTVIAGLNFNGKPVYGLRWRLKEFEQLPIRPIGLVFRENRDEAYCKVVKCKTRGCGNCINYDSLRRNNFPEFKRRCPSCRTFNGMVLESKELWRDRKYVTRIYWSGPQVRFEMRCRHRDCDERMYRTSWFTFDGKCKYHRTGARYLNGILIVSDWVWRRRARILKVSWGADGKRRYHYKCITPGCSTVKFGSLGNMQRETRRCRACAFVARRRTVNELGFSALKRRAANKKIVCTLTQSQFDDLAKVTSCFYCAKKITRASWARLSELKRAPPYFIDRIDNRKGYSWENSVVCCKACNRIKNAWHEASHMMALRSFTGWESELLLLVRKMKPDRVRRLAAKHRRSGG